MMSKQLNGYELSRYWFDWCFENPEKVSPNHTAIYFFAVEHCNRLGWKVKFGFPSQMTMDALGIKKHSTYIRYFNDLVDWKFFNLIQKSTNQYSANIISLLSDTPKNGKALDKAFIKHGEKQSESNGQSKRSIDKQVTIKTIKLINNNAVLVNSKLKGWVDTEIEKAGKEPNIPFESFWELYNKKKGDKDSCISKWNDLTDTDRTKIIETLPSFVKDISEKRYQPFPATYLNQKRWNNGEDEPKQTSSVADQGMVM